MPHPFFKNNGPFKISEIIKFLNLNIQNIDQDKQIYDIKDLVSSSDKDITFFHSKKYKDIAKKTKASFCLTTDALKNDLPESCLTLIVDNVLVSTSKITSMFYPDAVNDNFDETVLSIDDTHFKDKVSFGKNVLIGSNVSIGHNCQIGHNTIIEKNVVIGDNCLIGSNNIIRNTLIKNYVYIVFYLWYETKKEAQIAHPNSVNCRFCNM